MSQVATKTFYSAAEVSGDYRDMLVRLMTRQLWAETATAEVFGQSISSAPTWNEKFQAAEFAFEEAQHSQMLIDLLEDLDEDVSAILDARPDAAKFSSLWGDGARLAVLQSGRAKIEDPSAHRRRRPTTASCVWSLHHHRVVLGGDNRRGPRGNT